MSHPTSPNPVPSPWPAQALHPGIPGPTPISVLAPSPNHSRPNLQPKPHPMWILVPPHFCAGPFPYLNLSQLEPKFLLQTLDPSPSVPWPRRDSAPSYTTPLLPEATPPPGPHLIRQSCPVTPAFTSTQNLPKASYFLDSPPFCPTPMPAPIFPVLIGEREGPFQRPLLGGVGVGQEV